LTAQWAAAHGALQLSLSVTRPAGGKTWLLSKSD
jgi:hypothetical protein